MLKKPRVRFAPSPTGGLHLGGVRTVLYNYLFARQAGGKFILRIEDTDQSRFVPGAEEYIFECLRWCELEPDESPIHGGPHGPYRQSERKEIYRSYAEQLVKDGHAYYAFDSPEELEQMRHDFKTTENPAPQYDHRIRTRMRNSLTIDAEEVSRLIGSGVKHVIRIKMPSNEIVSFTDMIRGQVSFETDLVDDKVLLKADGMPTYHLAVVVDDYLMKISHAFRGEEWLPSAPVHILLWKYLFGLEHMPHWAHLPLILGPSGKLSKRDGAKFGFPVFAMNWTDPQSGEMIEGFKEKGFLPAAFLNLLALLGWNAGTEQEIYTRQELVRLFSIERVHSGGAKFDYEKAKWFNHEWIKKSSPSDLLPEVKKILGENGFTAIQDAYLERVIATVKDRCVLLPDFFANARLFFEDPHSYDEASVKPKWDKQKANFFEGLRSDYLKAGGWDNVITETIFKEAAVAKNLKPGDLQMIYRIMLVGEKKGPGVFLITELLGKEKTLHRIESAEKIFNQFI